MTADNDGRIVRGMRSRMAVAEAMLALIEEGNLRPPLREVATRAGVSLRLVHNHFADREQLFGVAATLQMERLAKLVEVIAVDGPFDRRLDKFVRNRTALLEAVTSVRRAALAEEQFFPGLRASLAAIREAKRRQVINVFGSELNAKPSRGRADMVSSVCAVASWSMWEQLRAHQGLSLAQARRVMKRMLAAMLSTQPSDTKSGTSK